MGRWRASSVDARKLIGFRSRREGLDKAGDAELGLSDFEKNWAWMGHDRITNDASLLRTGTPRVLAALTLDYLPHISQAQVRSITKLTGW